MLLWQLIELILTLFLNLVKASLRVTSFTDLLTEGAMQTFFHDYLSVTALFLSFLYHWLPLNISVTRVCFYHDMTQSDT